MSNEISYSSQIDHRFDNHFEIIKMKFSFKCYFRVKKSKVFHTNSDFLEMETL